MGIRISKEPAGPYWMEGLPFGIRFRASRPIDTAIYDFAQARAVRLVRDLGEHAGAIETAGGAVSGLPSLTDPDAMAGLTQTLFVVGLAQGAILDWEGVENDDGEPVVLVFQGDPADPASPIAAAYEAIDRVIREWPAVANAFASQYPKSLLDRIIEGKGSGTSPLGTTAEAPTIAEGAETPVSPAAAASP